MASLPIAIFNFEGEVQESNLRPLPEMVLRLSAALSSLKAVAGYNYRFASNWVTSICCFLIKLFTIISQHITNYWFCNIITKLLTLLYQFISSSVLIFKKPIFYKRI